MDFLDKTNGNCLGLALVPKFQKEIRAPKIGKEKAAVLCWQLTR